MSYGTKGSSEGMEQLRPEHHALRCYLTEQLTQRLSKILNNTLIINAHENTVSLDQLDDLNELLGQANILAIKDLNAFNRLISFDLSINLNHDRMIQSLEEVNFNETLDVLIQDRITFDIVKSLYPRVRKQYFKSRVAALCVEEQPTGKPPKMADDKRDQLATYWQKHIAGGLWGDLGSLILSLRKSLKVDYRVFWPCVSSAIALMHGAKQENHYYVAPYLEFYSDQTIIWDQKAQFSYSYISRKQVQVNDIHEGVKALVE
jgi:hypothetical protein